MLTNYIQAAMRQAKYELLEDGTFYGSIPSCKGVWSSEDSLERCREDLQEALEGWIILGLRHGHSFPEIDGVNLIDEAQGAAA